MKAKLLGMVIVSLCGFSLHAKDSTTIKGGKDGNWWILGETVNFTATEEGKKIISNEPVTGIVFDINKERVAEKTVSGKDFKVSGWDWTPETPGFYYVKFVQSGKAIANTVDFKAKIRGKIYAKEFLRKRHNFIVAAATTPPPSEISPQFGMSPHAGRMRTIFPLSSLIGFNKVRYHMLKWSLVEKEKGKLNFTGPDEFLGYCKRFGYEFENVLLNVFGTPYWASTNKSKERYVTYKYETATPENIEDWTNFLRKVCERYPQIRHWELWNEPAFPGASCFWSGTPEQFAKLHIAGAKVVREMRPEAKIYFYGGVPFLEELVKLGVGEYIDIWSRHGTNLCEGARNKVLEKHGIGPKPWANVEWHISLLRTTRPFLKAPDELLVRNMILYFAKALGNGAESTCAFCITNNVEKENLLWLKDKGVPWINHTCGFFRRRPYHEPRLHAWVWRNFVDCFKGDISFKGVYNFNKDEQQAILLSSDAGPLLVICNLTNAEEKLAPELLKAIRDDSGLFDWSGQKIQADADFLLKPNVAYWVKNPDMNVMGTWKNLGANAVANLDMYNGGYAEQLEEKFIGAFRPGKLFESNWDVVDNDTLKWMQADNYASMEGKPKAGKFKVEFAVGMDKSGLDLLVRVQDPKHIQTADNYVVWNADSLQFAIDSDDKGNPARRIEFCAALQKDGAKLWKIFAPDLGGDLPDKYTYPPAEVEYGKIKIEKTAEGLLYKIHVDAYDLHPYVCNGKRVRFSLLVNNNDGQGRDGYLEWSTGIGALKSPGKYGSLYIPAKNKNTLKQSDLKSPFQEGKLEVSENRIKVSTATAILKKRGAGVSAPVVELTPNAAYDISFSAKGNVSLIGMLTLLDGKNKHKRFDYLNPLTLTEKWTEVKKRITIPPEMVRGQLHLFFWRQNGEFEIKDFQMNAVID